jgi:hypothetical protein
MPSKLIQVFLSKVAQEPSLLVPLVRLVFLEILSRTLGWVDYHVLGKNPYVWQMISR